MTQRDAPPIWNVASIQRMRSNLSNDSNLITRKRKGVFHQMTHTRPRKMKQIMTIPLGSNDTFS
jgi:hypothetical protein